MTRNAPHNSPVTFLLNGRNVHPAILVSCQQCVQCLTSAFDVVAGRVKPDEVFDFSAYGFWQAVFGNWILGIVLAVFPLFALGVKFIVLFSGINTVICTDSLACAGLDGQGRSVYPVSCALFMGRITSGGAVWADHNSNADDRDRHVTNCDSARCGLDFDLAVQAGT